MHRMRWLVLAAADALVLAEARGALPAAGGLVQHPSETVDRLGADEAAAVLAGAALWCLAVWVAIGLLAGAAAALPGATGKAADVLARHLLPGVLYRVAAGAAGLGVVLAPAVASAATPTPVPSAPTAAWPSDRPIPAPAWPLTPPQDRTDRPPAAASARSADRRSVVVRPGDSLWSIAADHLPAHAGAARIARSWPRWYAANRAVIGADPDLIRPGQVLRAPDPRKELR